MTPEILGRILRRQDVDPMDRLVCTLGELAFVVSAARNVGAKIGLTSGSFDLGHIGHTRYVRKGWQRVNNENQVGLMFVAVEEDEKITRRKGPNRPVIPFVERVELMASTLYGDIMVLKKDSYEKWAVIKTVQPDVLLAVEETYTPEQVIELQKYCGEVYVVPRQAENSTSAQVRKIQIGGADQMIIQAKKVFEETAVNLPGELSGLTEEEALKKLKRFFDQTIETAYGHVSGKKE